MRQALEIIRVFFRIGFLNEAAYRANFYAQALESLVTVGTALGAVAIVFTQTDTLAGWRPEELVGLLGVYFVVLGVINLVISPSLQKFMEDVVTGNLDYTLTKPADSQLLVSVSQVQVWKLVDLGVGVVLLVAATVQRWGELGLRPAAAFLAAMVCGAAIVYSFWIVLATLAFWFIRIENILQIFWATYMAGRWPVGIYPDWLRLMLTVVVPVAFAVTVPAEALAGRLSPQMLASAAALAVALLAFSRWFWRRGLRRYSGASA
ncbi:MAG TPA: ABC-2 family transporter protein [Gammaproteobacteria bacterium]